MPYKDTEVAKAYFKNYRTVNCAAVKAAQKKCYQANTDYYKKKSLEYHHENRDLVLKKQRDRWQKNRDILIPKLRQRRTANIEVCRKRERDQYWTPRGLNNVLRRNFGITIEEYNALLEKQNGVCAICQSKHKTMRLSVDHCHKTGKVRGLLCGRCNTGIGMLLDSPELVTAAKKYLESYTTNFEQPI